MILDNPYASGSLAVQNNLTASDGLYTGDLTVVGTINATVQGISATASYVEFSNIDGKPELLSGSAQIATDISGSFTELSSSLELRVANNEATGSDQESRLGTLEGKTLISGSDQIATDISGSFTSLSSSLELRITNNEATGSDQESRLGTLEGKTLVSSSLQIASDVSGSFTNVSSSLSGRVVNLELTASNHEDRLLVYETSSVLSGSLQIADDISGSLGVNATLIRSLTAAEISGSLGANATLIRSLTADGISGSLGANADLIRSLTAAEISGSLGANATLIRSLTATGITGSFTSLSSSIASDINTKLNFADTGSFAKTDVNNSFGGVQTFESINVNATASFGYVQAVTGSATYIGDEFVIVNASVDGARFAGIQVYDSESNLQHTASLAWDSLNNKWIYANASGSTYSGGGLISGPRNTGSLGEETFPTLNYIVRGQGGDHIYNSNIIDNDTTVKIGINTEVTGSLIVSSGITGALTGNASTATSASYSTYAASAGSAGSATTATSASYASNASTADSATAATSASYSSNASTADSATTATSASHAGAAPYSGLYGTVPTWNQNTSGNAATATTLQTARTIGGVSFNGSANINLPGVNTAGNQDTSGNAATATALQTARTIGGVSFNGTANINLPGVNTAGNQDTSGNAATATKTITTISAGSDADLVYATVGSNDYFRIRAGGASNAGYAEIATADDGTEPIYVRQYTGTFTSLTRTATLLDGSGNTTFPGTLAVGGASATINGNTVWHTGNDGGGSGLDADLLDGYHASSFILKDTGYEWTGVGSSALSFRSSDVLESGTGDLASLEVYQDTAGADAFMQFHINSDYAAYFGLKGDINDFAVGGWSMGANYYRVWHAGNDGAGSGLDADNLDGVTWGNVNTDIIPSTNGTRNLGSSSYRWNTVYTSDLSMSNGIGDYTIVEGEEDLFLYNNKNGKVYKFLIQEVDPSAAPAKRE